MATGSAGEGGAGAPADAADADWMRLAIDEARAADAIGDWPAGAVIVRDGRLLACGRNRQCTTGDPLAHAETDAIRRACRDHGAEAVRGATLYATMEPCPMCAGALQLAGIATVVLALRHARLGRTDLGRYRLEAFCEMTGQPLALRDGVREGEYLALRRAWGKDRVKPEGPA